MRRLTAYILIILLVGVTIMSGCANNNQTLPTTGLAKNGEFNPLAVIEMEGKGIIYLELYPDVAPNTVKNFISLANSGFYNGLVFHRTMKGFMIQGGCPQGTGRGGPGYAIMGDFSSNGFSNKLAHERGVISMARSQSPDSAGSQFFIMHQASPHLDGDYAGFGKVLEGMDVVDDIVGGKVLDGNGTAAEPRVIKKITVDTFGVDYGDPDKLPDPRG